MSNTSFHDDTITAIIDATRVHRRERSHQLEQLKGHGAPRRIELGHHEVVIGRAEIADITLLSERASRRHATIVPKKDDHVIRDCDSRNGVYLNGIRVHSAILRDGDVLQIADGIFVFRES